MGGKAAKERRRLQRLAAGNGSTEKGTTNDQNKKAKHPQKKEPKRFVSSKFANPSSRVVPPTATATTRDGRFFIANRPTFAKDHHHPPRNVQHDEAKNKNNNNNSNKPKFKKPKHLKRKIEKLSEEEQEREKLIKELKEWEDLKMVKHKPKKQKTTHSHHHHEHQVPKNKEPVMMLQQPMDVPIIALEAVATTPQTPNRVVAIDANKTIVEAADRSTTTTPKKNPAIASNKNETVTKEDHQSTSPKTNQVTVSDKKKIIFENEEDSSSDSDSDVSLEEATKRQRGRRRRGRQSTDIQAEGLDTTNEEVPVVVNHDNSKEMMEQPSSVEIHGKHEANDPKKTPKKDDKRRCIGRKPVTDFVIGQRYSGKVIYIKPFGAFIDIGCHSDAFCHVSRVRDDFCESISEAVNIGDEVSARVVEVDRQAKRVTVSLQSDARIDDERASIEARMHRRGKTKSSSSVTKNVAENKKTKLSSVSSNNVVDNTTPVKRESTEEEEPLDESMMSPTQIKRARKLARRAARREHSAETGIAA